MSAVLENIPGKRMRGMQSNVSVWPARSPEVKLLGTADLLLQGHLEGSSSLHSATACSCHCFWPTLGWITWMQGHFWRSHIFQKYILPMHFTNGWTELHTFQQVWLKLISVLILTRPHQCVCLALWDQTQVQVQHSIRFSQTLPLENVFEEVRTEGQSCFSQINNFLRLF